MRGAVVLCLLLLAIGCERARASEVEVRAATSWWGDRDWTPKERVAGATQRREAVVRGLFAAKNVRYPPRVLLFRGFKREGELEVWAGEAKLTKVATYGICAASGGVGPKRKEGDRQVPEGFYRIKWFNPASKFHLSMQISYPNKADRLLGDPQAPGGEIMIHGDCRSAGCLAMGDERIEELWLMAKAAAVKPYVHLFPQRDMDHLGGEHRAFWANLKQGLELFDKTKEPPIVAIDGSGRYRFAQPAPSGSVTPRPKAR